MKVVYFFFCFFIFQASYSQYSFSGYIDNENWQNTVYLSLVEDYRKISGVYYEQIIAKTTTDSLGYFEFKGNELEDQNRFYRIHVDNCPVKIQGSNHFNGHCDDSMEIIFIAKNTDTIGFPLSFDNEMFCNIVTNDPNAFALTKIDSIKNEMRFAFSEIQTTANKKLNNKKWFKTLQDYGEALNEPLAELYIYSFLSDRRSEFHNYYLEDLKGNSYYDKLGNRLARTYPASSYHRQYLSEINSDKYIVNQFAGNNVYAWTRYILYCLLFFSLIFNFLFINKLRKQKNKSINELNSKLTKQEKKILNLILEDKSNKEIADAMFVSLSTVKSHTNNIYKKLQVQSREDVKSLYKK